MLGSFFKAVVKTATLPIDIAADTIMSFPDLVENKGLANRTKEKIESIAEDLNDVL